ncbi:MAG: hypothetical protein IKS32_00995 [Solobacterium sp.]|nr:hypothetical protein [Solobacterium sp.]
MIVILCSISDVDYNDDVVPSLTHFAVRAHLKEAPYYASYIKEKGCIRLIDSANDNVCPRIIQAIPLEDKRSSRYCCVRRLIASHMNIGDDLYVNSIMDLGNTAEEAAENYFSALKKGIRISIYDSPFLNTDDLSLPDSPSDDMKKLIQRQIRICFTTKENRPVLKPQEIEKVSAMTGREKK